MKHMLLIFSSPGNPHVSGDQRRGLKRRSGHPLIAAISADPLSSAHSKRRPGSQQRDQTLSGGCPNRSHRTVQPQYSRTSCRTSVE